MQDNYSDVDPIHGKTHLSEDEMTHKTSLSIFTNHMALKELIAPSNPDTAAKNRTSISSFFSRKRSSSPTRSLDSANTDHETNSDVSSDHPIEAIMQDIQDYYQKIQPEHRQSYIRQVFGCQRRDGMGKDPNNLFIVLIKKIAHEPVDLNNTHGRLLETIIRNLGEFTPEVNLSQLVNTITPDGQIIDLLKKYIKAQQLDIKANLGKTFQKKSDNNTSSKLTQLTGAVELLSPYSRSIEHSLQLELQHEFNILRVVNLKNDIQSCHDIPTKEALSKQLAEELMAHFLTPKEQEELSNAVTTSAAMRESISPLRELIDNSTDEQERAQLTAELERTTLKLGELEQKETALARSCEKLVSTRFHSLQLSFHLPQDQAKARLESIGLTPRSDEDTDYISEQLAILNTTQPNFRDTDKRSAFHYSCILGDAESSSIMLEDSRKNVRSNANLHNLTNDSLQTPLHEALSFCTPSDTEVPLIPYILIRPEEQQLDIYPGCDLNRQDRHKYTPLMLAINLGLDVVIDMILMRQPSIKQTDRSGNNALHLLISSNTFDEDNIKNKIISRLIALPDARADVKNNHGYTPLALAILKNQPYAGIQLLKSSNPGLNIADPDGNSPLMMAIKHHHPQLAREILLSDHTIDLSIINQQGQSALMLAVQFGMTDVASRILKKPDNIDIAINQCDTEVKRDVTSAHNLPIFNQNAIIYCVKHRNADVLQLLLKRYANVNIIDNQGHTAFSLAMKDKQYNLALIIAEHATELDTTISSPEGYPPLISVLLAGQYQLAIVLLKEHNVAINMLDNKGNTALAYCVIDNQMDVLKELLEYPSLDVNPKEDEISVFSIAMEDTHYDTARLLVQHGSFNASIQNQNGQTPLQEAMAAGQTDIVQTILEHHLDTSGLLSVIQDSYSLLTLALEGKLPDPMSEILIQQSLRLSDEDLRAHLDNKTITEYCAEYPARHGILTTQLLNRISLMPKVQFYEMYPAIAKQQAKLTVDILSCTEAELETHLSPYIERYQSIPNEMDRGTYLRLLFNCQTNPSTPQSIPQNLLQELIQQINQIKKPEDRQPSYQKLEKLLRILLDSSIGFAPHGIEVIISLSATSSVLNDLNPKKQSRLSSIGLHNTNKTQDIPSNIALLLELIKNNNSSLTTLFPAADVASLDTMTQDYWSEQCLNGYKQHPNEKDNKGNTPLSNAIIAHKEELSLTMMRFSLPDLNLQIQAGTYTLHLAIAHNMHQVFREILKHNIDINAKDSDNNTALMIAIPMRSPKFATDLISKNIDLGITNIRGQTVLHLAIMNDKIDIFKALLNKGDVHGTAGHNPLFIKDNSKKTVLFLALEHKDPHFAIAILIHPKLTYDPTTRENAWSQLLDQSIRENNPDELDDIIVSIPKEYRHLLMPMFSQALKEQRTDNACVMTFVNAINFDTSSDTPHQASPLLLAMQNKNWTVSAHILGLLMDDDLRAENDHAQVAPLEANTADGQLAIKQANENHNRPNFLKSDYYAQSSSFNDCILSSDMPNGLANTILRNLPKTSFERVRSDAFAEPTTTGMQRLLDHDIIDMDVIQAKLYTLMTQEDPDIANEKKLFDIFNNLTKNDIKAAYPMYIKMLKNNNIPFERQERLVNFLHSKNIDINYTPSWKSFSIKDRIFIQGCEKTEAPIYPSSPGFLCAVYVYFQGRKARVHEKAVLSSQSPVQAQSQAFSSPSEENGNVSVSNKKAHTVEQELAKSPTLERK